MSKAEEKARQYGEELDNVLAVGTEDDNSVGEYAKEAYIAGYHQAEKYVELVAKITREEVIEEAVKWLEGNAVSYLDKCDNPTYMGGYFIKTKELAEDFRKYMEDNV